MNENEELMQQEQALRDSVVEGEHFQKFKATKAWKFFEEEIMMRLHDCGTKLQLSSDEKEIYRAQGEMKQLNSLLKHVAMKIEEGKQAKRTLEGGEAGQ